MLGIIGGMGPAASMLFYKMLIDKTPAAKDQDHLNLMLLSHADMPDRTETILSGDEARISHLRDLLQADIDKLLADGCTKIVITCNTSHYFVNMLEERDSVIHMIDEAAAFAKAKAGARKVAVLATDGTVKTGIYQDALTAMGLDPYVPDANIQAKVMSVIYDYIKKGEKVPESLWNEIDFAVKEAGCDCAVLGCTELSVLSSELGLDISPAGFYIDPMDVVANRCIELFRPQP